MVRLRRAAVRRRCCGSNHWRSKDRRYETLNHRGLKTFSAPSIYGGHRIISVAAITVIAIYLRTEIRSEFSRIRRVPSPIPLAN
jgi:hypothetical protein